MSPEKKIKQQAQEIANECRELYEEICDLQKKLGWPTQKALCEKVFVEMYDDFADEKEKIRKLQARIKKMFHRKNWEQNRVTSQTLAHLQQIRKAIYRTDDYRYSDLYGNELPPKIREGMAKESEKLRKWLKETDYE